MSISGLKWSPFVHIAYTGLQRTMSLVDCFIKHCNTHTLHWCMLYTCSCSKPQIKQSTGFRSGVLGGQEKGSHGSRNGEARWSDLRDVPAETCKLRL